MYKFFTLAAFLGIFAVSTFSWGITDHKAITDLSLKNVISDVSVLYQIALVAGEPDYYHKFCPPSFISSEAPCLHGHRITDFLCSYDGRFYQEKLRQQKEEGKAHNGAEEAVVYWVSKAREAYLKHEDKWMRYLGWATHYLADAMCPPHCAPTPEQQEWWGDGVGSRGAEFEYHFDPTDKDWAPYLQGKSSFQIEPFPDTIEQIPIWIVKCANQVASMPVKVDFPYLEKNNLQKIMAMIGIGIRGIYNYVTKPSIPSIKNTATILVIDVSGSMSREWRGGVKIESAKKAALQYIEQVANEPRPAGVTHYIGVVTFSDNASLACPLTSNYNDAKQTVISLGTIAWTNLGSGLDTALQELNKIPAGAPKFIILLSDGMTNRGKSREAILQTSVTEARGQGICIHTVGFGDPGDIDEDFLKKIATQSSCGSYNYASSGFELFTTYVKVRHATLGSNRFVEYKTTTPAYFLPGESITLGAFQLTAPAQELHYTVAWSGPVVLQAKLVDPQGRVVDNRYPNSVIYSGSGFSHVTVFSPIPGIWRAAATVKSATMQPAEYYGVASARTGGYVIPYIPPPCLIQVDNTCVIPMPDLPTVVVVAIGIAVWIWWLYNQFGGFLP